MTLAGGGNEWRSRSEYEHLAGRADLAAMLGDPRLLGASYIVTSTDEDIPSEAPQTGTSIDDIIAIIQGLGRPPGHVIGYRTPAAKLGVYSYFAPGTINIEQAGQESELYNYQRDGIGEVVNHAPTGSAPDQALYDSLYAAVVRSDDRRSGYRTAPTAAKSAEERPEASNEPVYRLSERGTGVDVVGRSAFQSGLHTGTTEVDDELHGPG